jgi:hypothetical protein
MRRYLLYGLTVGSDAAVPGLRALPGAGRVDLRIRWPGEDPPPAGISWDQSLPTRSESSVLHVSLGHRDSEMFRLLRYTGAPGFIDFVVDSAVEQLWVQWSERVAPGDVRSVLTGELMGCILRLRGVTCLHASVVAVGDAAVALVGSKGAGKSTTAGAMAALGHPVLTDDLAPLTETSGGFVVEPGYARVRLRPDATRALYGATDALEPVWQIDDKHYVELSPDEREAWRFQADALPLRAVYVLTARDPASTAPALQPRSRSDALTLLLQHVYYTRAPMDRDQLARDFASLARLVQATPVRTLERPNGLDRLPEVCRTIVGDALAVSAA